MKKKKVKNRDQVIFLAGSLFLFAGMLWFALDDTQLHKVVVYGVASLWLWNLALKNVD